VYTIEVSDWREDNPTLRKHLIREENTRMREEENKGIIETLKGVTTEHQLAVLTKTFDGYAYASPKTRRKFWKIARKKSASFRK
tara:strand:- start:138 stop:389 length:252 start_codon:yes stop_codon:yes gene_type:complete